MRRRLEAIGPMAAGRVGKRARGRNMSTADARADARADRVAPGETYSLFDESEIPRPARLRTADLVIRGGGSQTLSKEQRAFNRLTRRISNLEVRIEQDRERLDALADFHAERVLPQERRLAELEVELARALAASTERFRYGKRQIRFVAEALVDLFDGAFGIVKPDAETEAIYDRWAGTSYREELQRQNEELNARMADDVREAFGIDLDLDLESMGDSPEALREILRQIGEGIREDAGSSESKAAEPKRRPRRKTRRRQEREEFEKQESALAKKSLRDVYLSLAKVLHPDRVDDDQERSTRLGHMKEAVNAYECGDLAALLKLEIRWVQDAGLESLAEEKLRGFIRALKEHVRELEDKRQMQVLDPRYLRVQEIAHLSRTAALGRLREDESALEDEIEEVESSIARVVRSRGKRVVVEIAEAHLERAEYEAALEFDAMLAARFRGDPF